MTRPRHDGDGAPVDDALLDDGASAPAASSADVDRAPMRPDSPILDVVVRAEFHVFLVLSVYLLFAGHNQPGGGFVGGLVAGAALTSRYVAGGPAELRRATRLRAVPLLGVGLLVAVTTAFASLVDEGEFLQHRLLELELPVIGPAKTSSAFFFDLGVYLVVVGTVLAILEALGQPSEDER